MMAHFAGTLDKVGLSYVNTADHIFQFTHLTYPVEGLRAIIKCIGRGGMSHTLISDLLISR